MVDFILFLLFFVGGAVATLFGIGALISLRDSNNYQDNRGCVFAVALPCCFLGPSAVVGYVSMAFSSGNVLGIILSIIGFLGLIGGCIGVISYVRNIGKGVEDKKQRQKGYRLLMRNVSDIDIRKVNEYYIYYLEDVDDDFKEKVEALPPRRAFVLILDQYWEEHSREYPTIKDWLVDIYDSCGDADGPRVELSLPSKYKED